MSAGVGERGKVTVVPTVRIQLGLMEARILDRVLEREQTAIAACRRSSSATADEVLRYDDEALVVGALREQLSKA